MYICIKKRITIMFALDVDDDVIGYYKEISSLVRLLLDRRRSIKLATKRPPALETSARAFFTSAITLYVIGIINTVTSTTHTTIRRNIYNLNLLLNVLVIHLFSTPDFIMQLMLYKIVTTAVCCVSW